MDAINIRTLQHFQYCPHRWGLLEIGDAWAENYFVVKANLLHKRVHEPNRQMLSKEKKTFTSVDVWNDLPEYNLYGVLDCLEATKTEDGVCVDHSGCRYALTIVEYKPTKPKYAPFHPPDAIQVFAQKLCVDYVFGTDCDAVLYYADVKQRVTLPFATEFAAYDEQLRAQLVEMREYLQQGQIPPIKKGQRCSGCSMQDLCMPKIKKQPSLREQIEKELEESL
jgi:CRISPR-associated exonuclease Cas4